MLGRSLRAGRTQADKTKLKNTNLEQAQQIQGQWQILAAAVLWGTTGTVQTFAPLAAQPQVLGGLRLALGALVLLAIAIGRKQLNSGGRWPLLPIVGAALGMAFFNLLFFSAIAKTGVAVGTTIFIGCTPVFAGVLGYLLHGERLNKHWFVATGLAILGCCFLTLTKSGASVDLSGVLMAVGAGASYSWYNAIIKKVVQYQTPMTVVALVSCLGALFLAPVVMSADLQWLALPGGMEVVCYLGLFATAAPYWLLANGLKVVPLANVATLNLAEPLVATSLGVLVVGERLTGTALLGVCLLFVGLLYLTITARASEAPKPIAITAP